MKLAIREVIELSEGLARLDGYDAVYRDGEKERLARVYYKLSAGLLLSIALSIDVLKPVVVAHEKARQALVYRFAETGKNTVSEANTKEFSDELQKLLEEEHDFGDRLKKFRSDELRLGYEKDQNQVPASTLALIQPLLRD